MAAVTEALLRDIKAATVNSSSMEAVGMVLLPRSKVVTVRPLLLASKVDTVRIRLVSKDTVRHRPVSKEGTAPSSLRMAHHLSKATVGHRHSMHRQDHLQERTPSCGSGSSPWTAITVGRSIHKSFPKRWSMGTGRRSTWTRSRC